MIRNKKMRVVSVDGDYTVTVEDNTGKTHTVTVDKFWNAFDDSRMHHIVIVDGYSYIRYVNYKSTGAKYLRRHPCFPKRISDVCPGFDFRYIYYSYLFGYPVNSV